MKTKLKKRISIIKSSVYDLLFTSNDPKNISFNLILNRIIVLIQIPITFVLYRKEGDNYIRHHSFVVDETHKKKFLNELEKHEQNKIFKNKDYLFKFFHSENYRLCVFRIEKNNDTTSNFIIVNNADELCSENGGKKLDEINTYIQIVLKKFFKGSYSDSFLSILEQSVNSILLDDESVKVINDFDFIDQDILIEKTNEFKKKIDESISNTFKKVNEVTKVLNSLCLEGSKERSEPSNLSNILFFVRDYSNIDFSDNKPSLTKRRESIDDEFNGYDYNIRICIPEAQKQEIKEYFLNIKKENVRNFYESDDYKLKKALDDWFWNSIQNDREKFIEDIIYILSEKLGKHARSITDASFQNGLVQFRKPFQKGGLDRAGISRNELDIENINDQKIEEKLLDCKRIIICHYLFSGMLNQKYSDDSDLISAVMIPVEVNGSVFAVTLHIVALEREGIEFYHSNDVWHTIFHLYSGIGARIERNLRKYLKNIVVDIKSKCFFDKLNSDINNAFINYEDNIYYGLTLAFSNKVSLILSCFIPYDYVNFYEGEDKKFSRKIFFQKIDLNYSELVQNIFFIQYRKNTLGTIDQSDFTNTILDENSKLENNIGNYIKCLQKR